jgi:hypothetical protein
MIKTILVFKAMIHSCTDACRSVMCFVLSMWSMFFYCAKTFRILLMIFCPDREKDHVFIHLCITYVGYTLCKTCLPNNVFWVLGNLWEVDWMGQVLRVIRCFHQILGEYYTAKHHNTLLPNGLSEQTLRYRGLNAKEQSPLFPLYFSHGSCLPPKLFLAH